MADELDELREQLRGVEAALADTPDDPELMKAKEDLLEVIRLTESLGASSAQNEEQPQPAQQRQVPAPTAAAPRPAMPKGPRVERETPKEVPKYLKIKPTDSEQVKATKKRKAKAIKKRIRAQSKEEESSARQQSWKSFATKCGIATKQGNSLFGGSRHSGEVATTAAAAPHAHAPRAMYRRDGFDAGDDSDSADVVRR